MKKLLFLSILLAIFATQSKGQSYPISSHNGQTITTCSGTFYDSGGNTGGYVGGQNYIVTFAPATFGTFTNVTFTSFAVSIGDALEVYDGANTSSPLIAIYNVGNSPVGYTIRPGFFNPTGKLTFKWTSTANGAGWAANISCGIPCQTFNTIITSSTPPFTIDSGIYFIDICPGDSVSLRASANFPINNMFYHQDTLTTQFTWDFGGTNIVQGQQVNAVFNNIQGYNASIIARDTNNCMANQTTEVRIRVSTPPTFNGTISVLDSVCQYEENELRGAAQTTPWKIRPSLSVAGTTYLPDGVNISYISNLVFSGFGVNQTIQQPTDILQVFAEIEHSYLGDLDIVLKCPNNSSVTLKSYPGGSNTFLGEPIDNNAAQIPGLGYMYHWKSTGTTTMTAAAGTYNHSFTDVNGNSYANASYLPPSTTYPATSTAGMPRPIISYLPETPFSNLVGCPLNGSWSITVTDNLAIDNGFIFSWGIDFDPALLPVAWGYQPVIDTSFWNVGGGDTVIYRPQSSGNQPLTYTMKDMAGCAYDTTINVYIKPAPRVNLGNDTSACMGDTISLNSGNSPPGTQFTWNTGATTDLIQVAVINTQKYYVTATSLQGCSNNDSVELSPFPFPQLSISNDTLICIGTSANLQASGGTIYQWSNGGNINQINVSPTSSQTYLVTVTDTNQCVKDTSVYVQVVPLPTITISNDTSICDGTSVRLWAKGGQYYQWNEGARTSVATFSPTDHTTYSVIVEDTNTCRDSAEVEVRIIPMPTPMILSDYDTICRGGAVTLNALGGQSYIWSNRSNLPSWTSEPRVPTRYGLMAMNSENGTNCTDTTSYFVYVEFCALYVPSAFSPNNDQLNDQFGPQGIVSNNASYEFIIFDRWGKVIFKTNRLFEYWDGTIDGTKAPEGVYPYVIRVAEKSIEPYELVGTVTLLR